MPVGTTSSGMVTDANSATSNPCTAAAAFWTVTPCRVPVATRRTTSSEKSSRAQASQQQAQLDTQDGRYYVVCLHGSRTIPSFITCGHVLILKTVNWLTIRIDHSEGVYLWYNFWLWSLERSTLGLVILCAHHLAAGSRVESIFALQSTHGNHTRDVNDATTRDAHCNYGGPRTPPLRYC